MACRRRCDGHDYGQRHTRMGGYRRPKDSEFRGLEYQPLLGAIRAPARQSLAEGV